MDINTLFTKLKEATQIDAGNPTTPVEGLFPEDLSGVKYIWVVKMESALNIVRATRTWTKKVVFGHMSPDERIHYDFIKNRFEEAAEVLQIFENELIPTLPAHERNGFLFGRDLDNELYKFVDKIIPVILPYDPSLSKDVNRYLGLFDL